MSSGEVIDAGRIETLLREERVGSTLEQAEQPRTLRESVRAVLDEYFEHLDGQPVTDLYDLVLAEIEVPLLESVLKVTRNNQTRCATMLGLNRGTLRKKLKKYGLL